MRKKILACLLAGIALCGSISAFAAAPALSSPTACLMDADSGQILYQKSAQTELPMASITKVMTALLVIENGDLSASTTATAEAINSVDLESTRIGFEPNEQLTVDELMYSMLVYSANDAANILAVYTAGDLQTFVNQMNEKAKELGCTHTHFANPNGLDTDGHYSCAEDMARITRAANQHPEFSKYSSTVSYVLPADNLIGPGWEIRTKVNMIKKEDPTYDARVYAAKTGWTTKAHNTFVACGKSENANLIVTVLGCPMKNGIFLDTTALLNYGEQAYQPVTVTAEEYRAQAKKAAKQAGCSIDTDALSDITLRLPKGMGANDLAYTCAKTETGAQLTVCIAESSRQAYTAVTNTDGAQPLLQMQVPLRAAVKEEPKAVPAMAQEVEPQADALPLLQNDGALIAVCVAGATLIVFALMLVIGLVRRISHKNKV